MLENTDIPEIKKAAKVIRNMSADAVMREMAEMREKALHNEATAISHAIDEGIQIGEQCGIQIGEQRGEQKLIEKLIQGGMSEEQLKKILNGC